MPTVHSSRRWLLPAAVLILAACGESQPADVDSGTPPDTIGGGGLTQGVLLVRVPVTRPELDPDGFVLTLDGAKERRVFTAEVRWAVPAGRHTLVLGGLAAGCDSPAGTVEVEVEAGGLHAVDLPVVCRGGVLRWRAEAMTGPDVDHDGYVLEVLRDGALARDAAPISDADSVGLAVLAVGSYDLRLAKLSFNCSGRFAGGPNATVTVDDTVDVTIQVTCQPLPRGGIVFSDGRNIYRLNEPWGEPVLIQRDGKAPSWSPDLDRIAFARDGLFEFTDGWYGTYRVPGPVVMAANGTGATPVGNRYSYAPRFLSDGRIWLGENDAALSADGTSVGRLGWSLPEGTTVLDASRDAEVIAVFSFGGSGAPLTRGVHTVRPDGTALGRVADVAENDWSEVRARLSPDGRRIAAKTGRGVVIADIDGANARTLPVGGSPLAWSPGGDQLLVGGGGSLEIVRASDGALVQVLWRGASTLEPTADWR